MSRDAWLWATIIETALDLLLIAVALWWAYV
jgi:hypothetical protein